jgi:hypothetical protein
MLQILHKGIQMSIPMDQTGFTGNIATDSVLSVVTKMVGGRVAALTSAGLATLADGASAGGLSALGFIINDAAGYFFENKPALASAMIAITMGPCVIITDQIASVTFAIGDPVYAGTSGNVGLVTNVLPTGGRLLGIALSVASSASPALTIAVL